MNVRRIWAAAAAVVAAVPLGIPGWAGAQSAAPGSRFASIESAVATGALDGRVVTALRAGERPRVLVSLERSAPVATVNAALLPGAGEQLASDASPEVLVPPSRGEISAAVTELRADIGRGARIYRTYDRLPIAAVEVATEADLLDLVNATPTSGVSIVETWQAFDTEALPLIRQPAAAAAGSTGSGVVIGVIDSGLTHTNPYFGTCPIVPAAGCKVREMVEVAPPDGVLDDSGHGTFVAATALSVAPAAEIIAYDVFYNVPIPNTIPVRFASVTDSATVAVALDHLIGRRQQGVNVRAVNLSLGGSVKYTATCAPAGSAYPASFATAIANGILPVVASGNGGTVGGGSLGGGSPGVYGDGIASPSCVAGAASVGATYDSSGGGFTFSNCADSFRNVDWPTCYSQGAPILTVYAPGSPLAIAGVGSNQHGTSFASPHVAGAVAAVSQRNPGLSPAQLTTVLRSSGPLVFDPRRNGLIANDARRLDLVGALRVGMPLTNDAFASPTPIAFTPNTTLTIDGSTLLATSEPVDNTSGLPSIWFEGTPTLVGNLSLSGCPVIFGDPDFTNLNTVVAFTTSGVRIPSRGLGTSLTGCPGTTFTSTFRTRPGVPIRIMHATGVRAGTRLIWQLQPFQPSNDNRSAPLGIAASSSVSAEFDGSTREPGEVSAFGESGSTVWFTPGQSLTVTAISNCIGCDGSVFPPVSAERFFAAAWSGSTLLGYAEGTGATAASVGPFTVPVQVQVGTFGPADIAFAVADNVTPASPSNDTPATAAAIGSGWTGQNTLATAPGGELINGTQAQRSVWGSWTAPSAGTYVVRTIGSNFPTRVSVWSGTTATGSPICSAGPLGGVVWSQCVVTVTTGQQLLVGLDGVNGAHGTARLEVRQVAASARAAAPAAATGTGGRAPAPNATGSGSPGRTPAPETPVPVL